MMDLDLPDNEIPAGPYWPPCCCGGGGRPSTVTDIVNRDPAPVVSLSTEAGAILYGPDGVALRIF